MNWQSVLKSKRFWFNILSIVIALAANFGFNGFNPDPNTLALSAALIALINAGMGFIPSSTPTSVSRGVMENELRNYPEY